MDAAAEAQRALLAAMLNTIDEDDDGAVEVEAVAPIVSQGARSRKAPQSTKAPRANKSPQPGPAAQPAGVKRRRRTSSPDGN